MQSRIRRYGSRCMVVLAMFGLVLGAGSPTFAGPSMAARKGSARWGAGYFPNVQLTTHEGKQVRFFDDLIKDKVVAIAFIFTSCPDSCPLETARLANVQRILGDRMGRDVFFYSISIDPENDTPEVLAAYANRFRAGPGWLFLTGKEDDITELRRKLGLYIEEIQDEDSTDHNLSLIIGNQTTGRWMKRSPLENPYVLAEQLGSWLHNWKVAVSDQRSYADAPKLRKPSRGETLFRTRCAACHTIGEGEIVVGAEQRSLGPDLFGVTRRRDRDWLVRWLADPEKLLAEKDPIIMELFAQYGNVLMPNLRLNKVEIDALIDHMDAASLSRSSSLSAPATK